MEKIKNIKRFSVLALLIAIVFSTINLSYKQTHYTEVKETDYGTQEIKRDGNCVTITDNVKFVSDTNVSDKRETYGTDNKANLRELYYKDGYIYFKYLMSKNDEFSVGGITYVQTNKVKIETKLIQKSPAFEQRTDEDYTYNEGEPYSGSAILSIEEFNEDFGRVYVGELSDEDAKKYMGITAKVTMYYDSSDKLRDGLSMTRSVEYSIDKW